LSDFECPVSFFIGGSQKVVDDENLGMRVPAYPETLPRYDLRTGPLTTEWQLVQQRLSFKKDDARLSNVIVLLGWTIDNANVPAQGFEFEVRNIRYTRKPNEELPHLPR
jgi:hypothetical protein